MTMKEGEKTKLYRTTLAFVAVLDRYFFLIQNN